jgi:uroporphyrin-III C-methyltransferase/precorrin-2 dehydrogenase/sirohydrochlorin ferrochelatase
MLAGRRVLVVGGGTVATRRVPALIDAGASVVLVAPSLTPALHALAVEERIEWLARPFEASDVDGSWLVHVAVDEPEVARAASAAALQRRVFCVRADDRHAATAWTPATTRHGPVTVAVTAGGDPRRAVTVRDAIAELLAASPLTGPAEPGDPGSAANGAPPEPGSRAPARPAGVPAGRAAAENQQPYEPSQSGGQVVLVGAGPGDPELITVRGRRLLAAADVVLVDRLAPGLLLDELRPDVELIDASKIPHGPAATQEEINRVLVERARGGALVVRLKGGDPFVFARGGEEMLACAAAGVPVTVVPGVTSAVAAPAAAGIPVTHRGVAHEFVVVSGHLPPGHPESLVDWAGLARLRGTLCILMGLTHLDAIAAELMAHGRAPTTPAAAIRAATTRAQRTVRADLGGIATAVMASHVRPPAVVVIGDVVDALRVGERASRTTRL